MFLDDVNIGNQVVTIRGACKKQLRASKGANVTIQRVEHVGSNIGIHARAYSLKEKMRDTQTRLLVKASKVVIA